VFLIDNFPLTYGGRSASMLTKARLFKELARVDSEIVLVKQRSDYDGLIRLFTERGALGNGLVVRRLQDYDQGDGSGRGLGASPGSLRRIHAAMDRLVEDDHVFVTAETRTSITRC